MVAQPSDSQQVFFVQRNSLFNASAMHMKKEMKPHSNDCPMIQKDNQAGKTFGSMEISTRRQRAQPQSFISSPSFPPSDRQTSSVTIFTDCRRCVRKRQGDIFRTQPKFGSVPFPTFPFSILLLAHLLFSCFASYSYPPTSGSFKRGFIPCPPIPCSYNQNYLQPPGEASCHTP